MLNMNSLPTDKIISCFYGSSEDCVKVVNPDGMLLSFNPNGLKVMEIDNARDVIGKDWLKFWDGNMRDKAASALKQAREGKLAKFEGYCPTYKGNMRYWEVSIAPLNDDHGYIQWLLVTSRDATRTKELEQLVQKQEKQLEVLKSQLNEK